MGKRGDDQHRYGSHYTPVEVARLLAAFAVRSPADLVFDPSCGDGRLLREVLRLKSTGPASNAEVFGLDRSSSATEIASNEGLQVGCADFFETEPGAALNPILHFPARFDAIIGNPPYIRQEMMGSIDKRRIEECLSRDKALAPDLFWPAWSRRSDIYVYFFAHSTRFLRPAGRLVFLTAGSWLDVGYGAALREFLLRNFRIVAILESAVESFFDDASINTVITVLDREPSASARTENIVRFVRLKALLSEVFVESAKNNAAVEFAHLIERASAHTVTGTHRIRVVGQGELLGQVNSREAPAGFGRQKAAHSGWGKYLRAQEVFFKVLHRGGASLKQLSDMANLRFGVKTGANEFFYIERGASPIGTPEKESDSSEREDVIARIEKVASADLKRLDEVAAVRRGLTTGANEFFYLKTLKASSVSSGSRQDSNSHRLVEDTSGQAHAIETRYLSPVVFSLKEIPGILLDSRETKRLLFNCDSSEHELGGTGALAYIRGGERSGYHLRPTCASRSRWYSVTRGMAPARLLFPSKVGERWIVAINRAGVFEDKKLYGIFPGPQVSELVLAALLNSTWVRYYAEITCRQMTGAQAIADIDVSVAEAIVLPDPRQLSESMKQSLEAALNAIALRPVGSVFKEVQLADRRMLDELVLTAIGFTDVVERKSVLEELYAAVVDLVNERLKK